MAIFMNLYFVSITHSYKQSLPHTYEKKIHKYSRLPIRNYQIYEIGRFNRINSVRLKIENE